MSSHLVFAELPAAENAKAVQDLYSRISTLPLDPARVYRVRDYSLDRAAIHITLNGGVLAFTEDVLGHPTGAYFEGDGEILLSPPSGSERASMALFTGAAILEESFSSAYFRFNDDSFADLLATATVGDAAEFMSKAQPVAVQLARGDALRLFISLAQSLGNESANHLPSTDKFLHGRIQGRTLGAFDVYFDSTSPEQVRASQLKANEGVDFLDTWTSFAVPSRNGLGDEDLISDTGNGSGADPIEVDRFHIVSTVQPPTTLKSEAWLHVTSHEAERILLFELSSELRIQSIDDGKKQLAFIQNPPTDGSQLKRRGDDLVAIVLPAPTGAGDALTLHFAYAGDVLSDAGSGLLYVGERGIWYPNRGLAMASFELEFHYPTEWQLVATGHLDDPLPDEAGMSVSRWHSNRAVPVAGFNLGRYTRVEDRSSGTPVVVFAAKGVEKTFPQPGVDQQTAGAVGLHPAPQRMEASIASEVSHALTFMSARFGRFPFDGLSLTQMPGPLSQGWPSLIFLSSYSFVSDQERREVHMDDVDRLLNQNVVIHELAHQWWGDDVMWSGYRDQWLIEALANYSSLLYLESEKHAALAGVMRKYRDDLLAESPSGAPEQESGPVTLGQRLSNSRFPDGYSKISYERGTWLMHMLHTLMRDAAELDAKKPGPPSDPFIEALQDLRKKYEGKSISTADFIHTMERHLPHSLWYEQHQSLDWFSDSWVNSISVPRLKLTSVKLLPRPHGTTVRGTLLQSAVNDQQVTAVPMYSVQGKNHKLIGLVFADGPETKFQITAPEGVTKVALNLESAILER